MKTSHAMAAALFGGQSKLFLKKAAIVLLVASASNPAAAVDTSILSIEDSKFSILIDAQEKGDPTCTPGKSTGLASLKPAFVTSLKASAGVSPFSLYENEGAAGAVVQTTFVTSTTSRHVDRLPPNEDGVRLPVPEGDLVTLVPLETNDDAHFDVENKCFSIKKGQFIHFEGGLPHRTVVESGTVSLLGPFHVMTMKSVGGSSDVCGDGTCSSTEDSYFNYCRRDCCGDETCSSTEDSYSNYCRLDCCGDGTCTPVESSGIYCFDDCCGDGTCSSEEKIPRNYCFDDCCSSENYESEICCGNDICETSEDTNDFYCAEDCCGDSMFYRADCCGNGICESEEFCSSGGRQLRGGQGSRSLHSACDIDCCTEPPTKNPTESPTKNPTESPTKNPTESPTLSWCPGDFGTDFCLRYDECVQCTTNDELPGCVYNHEVGGGKCSLQCIGCGGTCGLENAEGKNNNEGKPKPLPGCASQQTCVNQDVFQACD